MPQSNTQSYINGGANVRARASDLASSPEQRSKAATRFASRWDCSGDVAQRAAAALVTESAVLGEFDPAVLAFKTDEERAAAREKHRGRRDKKTRRTLIGLLRVVEGWARVVLGRDEACVWRAVRAPESRAAAWLGFARCCWGVAGRLLARIVESPGLPCRVQVRLVEEPRGGFKAVHQDLEEFTTSLRSILLCTNH